jgi:hypothetical protein
VQSCFVCVRVCVCVRAWCEREYFSVVLLYIVSSVHKFDCRLVMNGAHDKWQVQRRPCSDRDACFWQEVHVRPPPTVVTSAKGLYPSCEHQLHSAG